MAAIHVEVNRPSGTDVEPDHLAEACVEGLRDAGVISSHAPIATRAAVRIAGEYVLHDHHRERVLPDVLATLREQQIHSIGRYGGWGYGGIESAVLEGQQLASAGVR